jgi:hypothetical protein
MKLHMERMLSNFLNRQGQRDNSHGHSYAAALLRTTGARREAL